MINILKVILLTILISSFTTGSTTFGLFSEKLGTDFFNFSIDLYEKDNNKFFISIGPSIFLPTNLGIGWKRYYAQSYNKIVPFSCISIFKRYANRMGEVDGSAIRTDNCLGISGGISIPFKNIGLTDKRININLGVFTSHDFRNESPLILPFVNLEF